MNDSPPHLPPAAASRPAPRFAAGTRFVWLAVLLLATLPATGCKVWAPSNDRPWAADQALLPRADYDGDRVTIRNIRNCRYRDQEPIQVEWRDQTYDLNELETVDFIVMPFARSPELAHTMISFGFAGRDYLDVSVEVRKERGEAFSTVGGFLRQYEIMYVIADERDSIGNVTNQLLRDVYIYRTVATPEQSRALFRDVFDRANRLYEKPEFYHTLTNNCTTNIVQHVNNIATKPIPYNYQILFPGLADRLAYDRDLLVKRGSFEQTKLASRVNEKAYRHRDDPDFAIEIRR